MKTSANNVYGYTVEEIETTIIPLSEQTDFLFRTMTGIEATDLEAKFSQFETMFRLRCRNSIAFWTTDEVNLSSKQTILENEDAKDFQGHFIAMVNMTAEKYVTLLVQLDKVRAGIMADVTSSDVNRTWFNDTPQGPNANDKGEDLNHLSTFSKTSNETTSPMGTPAQRLAEISERVGLYWEEWLDKVVYGLHLED